METGTILIVDDNKGVLTSLELLLENEFIVSLNLYSPQSSTEFYCEESYKQHSALPYSGSAIYY